MSLVQPFRGLLYAPEHLPDLSRLVAGPYDVIPPEKRRELAERHPNNIVHLDLPAGGDAGTGPPDPYAAAAERLRRWRGGVLVRDPEPALYVCEQTYRAADGVARTRRGFFARLKLESLEGGTVLPHEKTLDRPRADRIRLLRATRTHLSAVFLLHPDPGGAVARRVAREAEKPPCALARDDDGTACRMVRVADPSAQGAITGPLEGGWVLIADGHHRYESALAYRDERRASGHADAETILAYLCSLADPGLSIFPIHRIVRGLPATDGAVLRERLGSLGSLERAPDLEAARVLLDREKGEPGRFALRFAGDEGAWVLRLRADAARDRPEMQAVPAPLRTLDVILLHRLVLEGLLGITADAQARQENLEYVKDPGQLEAAIRSGAGQIGFLMNPTRIEQVIEVSRAGIRLPQKSTYFYPKVLSGMVLDPLDG